MSCIGFQCNAGYVKFSDCLTSCPIGDRCLSLPTLRELSKQREWTGKPSTTQLLKGTREVFLEITKDYYIDPKSRAFQLLGTSHHALMEKNLGSEELAEIRIEEENETGQADHYDSIEHILTDYKTLGSFKVAQLLGLDFKEVDDPSGEVYVAGKNKGSVKKIKRWFCDESKVDNFEYAMQINRYRIMYERSGFPVDRMMLQITVRDGGTYLATGRGVEDLIYYIDIKRIDDSVVMEYFNSKAEALKSALLSGVVPKCTDKENWNGNKCEKYCNVYKFCKDM